MTPQTHMTAPDLPPATPETHQAMSSITRALIDLVDDVPRSATTRVASAR